jgi:CBS domain-containing protein
MDTEHRFVVDLMTKKPVLVGPDTPAWSADCLARRRNVHYLLVTDGYRLVGVVCGCDLEQAEAGVQVAACMRSQPVTIDDQETADAAVSTMRSRGVGCLPVLDWSGALRGVVTRHDLRLADVTGTAEFEICASCGSTHGLPPVPDPADGIPVFCRRCAEHATAPRSFVDEPYFTLGGGD